MRIKDFMNEFDNYMTAISFAEAGEFDTARQIARKKTKILVICSGSQEDNYAIKYAFSLVKRVQGVVKIFVKGGNSKKLTEQLEEGVFYETLSFSNFPEVARYLEEADLIIIADEKMFNEIKLRNIPLIFVQPNKTLAGG